MRFLLQAVIASYTFLGQLRDSSKELTFRVVIMDEAHYIKNKKVSGTHVQSCMHALVACNDITSVACPLQPKTASWRQLRQEAAMHRGNCNPA